MAKKKAVKTVNRPSPIGPFLSGQTPITIGGGSLYVHFKRSDFQKNGDRDNHKKPDVAITHILVQGEGTSPILDMNVNEPIMIVVRYA